MAHWFHLSGGNMNIRLRCRCGKLQGDLDTAAVAARAKCYCTDCRAFARFRRRSTPQTISASTPSVT